MPSNTLTPRNIGIWGSRSAGKTTYLGMLFHGLADSKWHMDPIDKGSTEFIMQIQAKIYTDRKFPDATQLAQGESPKIYEYWIWNQGWQWPVLGLRQEKAFRVEFVDAPGEMYERPEQWENDPNSPFNRLLDCPGIVCLLDPVRAEEDSGRYYNLVLELLAALKRRFNQNRPGPIKTYMAFCLAKLDIPRYYELYHKLDRNPEALAAKVLEPKLESLISRSCQEGHYKYFACSAIGTAIDRQTQKKCTNYYWDSEGLPRIYNPKQIKPIDVFEPLAWILGNLQPDLQATKP